MILTLVISGALAGMGAAHAVPHRLRAVAVLYLLRSRHGLQRHCRRLLRRTEPSSATMLASFFIQHITAGGAYVDKSMYCAQISDLISSIIIYLCGFVLFMKHVMNSSIAKRRGKGGSEGQGCRGTRCGQRERRRSGMSLLLQYTLIFASVLILVALGGCFSEHSGVINLGLEGIMIMGALGGALTMRYLAERTALIL